MSTSYFIAATPRCGSFLLCEGLGVSGIAGLPQEYAPRDEPSTWRDFHGFDSHIEYFFSFPSLCRTPNGVFGAKLMWNSFRAWEADTRRYLGARGTTAEVLESLIGSFRVVRLVRGDRLRQAISWVRARESGVWSVRRGEEPPALTDRVAYRADAVAEALDALELQDSAWDKALAGLGRPVLTVRYERLASDYRQSVSDVHRFLGLPGDFGLSSEPVLQRQADDVTEQWVDRASADLDPALFTNRRAVRLTRTVGGDGIEPPASRV